MNIQRLEKLASFIAKLPHGTGRGHFDMTVFHHGLCGTPACIAGWACHLFVKESVAVGASTHPVDAAQAALGLTKDQAKNLFLPGPRVLSGGYTQVTPTWAAKTIRRLAQEGEVRWQG